MNRHPVTSSLPRALWKLCNGYFTTQKCSYLLSALSVLGLMVQIFTFCSRAANALIRLFAPFHSGHNLYFWNILALRNKRWFALPCLLTHIYEASSAHTIAKWTVNCLRRFMQVIQLRIFFNIF